MIFARDSVICLLVARVWCKHYCYICS